MSHPEINRVPHNLNIQITIRYTTAHVMRLYTRYPWHGTPISVRTRIMALNNDTIKLLIVRTWLHVVIIIYYDPNAVILRRFHASYHIHITVFAIISGKIVIIKCADRSFKRSGQKSSICSIQISCSPRTSTSCSDANVCFIGISQENKILVIAMACTS
jgi:hypothetical protein